MENLEIERKWLIENIKDNLNLEDYSSSEILQAYVSLDNNGNEVRVRQKDAEFFLTAKSSGSLVRQEFEISISKDDFDNFLKLSFSRVVNKTRYFIPCNNLIIELDIYKNNLSVLMTAEVEFDSELSSSEFTSPDWFGREVTEDKLFKNRNLATKGMPDLILK